MYKLLSTKCPKLESVVLLGKLFFITRCTVCIGPRGGEHGREDANPKWAN